MAVVGQVVIGVANEPPILMINFISSPMTSDKFLSLALTLSLVILHFPLVIASMVA